MIPLFLTLIPPHERSAFFPMNRTFDDLVCDKKFIHHVQMIFRQKAADFTAKHVLEIEVTNQCSIGCFYCGATTETTTVHLDFDIACMAIDRYAESRRSRSITPHFSITGGDPVEYPRIKDLLTYLKERGVSFSMKLNPSTLSESFYQMIATSGCESVKLTFLGMHSQPRYRRKDTLDLIYQATQRFRHDRIPVVWHFSLGEFNREDLLDSLSFVVDSQASAVSIGRLARVGRLNERNYPKDISPSSFREFLHHMLLFYYNHKRHGFNLMFKEKLWVPFLTEAGILSEDFLNEPGIRLGCDAKERLLVLTYAGDLLGCGLLPQPVLAEREGPGFVDALQAIHPKEQLREESPCTSCRFFHLCRGCRGVIGGTNKPDPQCWVAGNSSKPHRDPWGNPRP